MLTRTWPYGTTRRGRVLSTQWLRRGLMVQTVAEINNASANEAHVLFGECGDPEAQDGDEGNLVFTEGPNGAFWKFTKDSSSGRRRSA